MKNLVTGFLTALSLVAAAPALGADIWWPKGGEEVAYTMFANGKKVGTSKITFSEDDGNIVAVQDNRMQLEIGGGIDVVARFVFREWWNGVGKDARFVKMTTHGQAKAATEKRRFTLKAEPNGDGKLVVESPRLGDRVAPEGMQPSTFWHLNHILAYDVFDPFAGGFAELSFDNLGAQNIKFDEGEGECLRFDLHVKYKDRDQLGELPPGVDREQVPLEQTFKAWFEPDGLMCALVMNMPFGTVAMVREYRKTE